MAWGESNAVVFANSVLGARTNRYGDFMDICCALAGRAPRTGLHLDGESTRHGGGGHRHDQSGAQGARCVLPGAGHLAREPLSTNEIAVVTGLSETVTEDQLKAMGAASASSGAVGLFHVEGVTPEAPDLATALGGRAPETVLVPRARELRRVRDALSTTGTLEIDAVALGSPHFSRDEFSLLEALLPREPFRIPFYVCTGRAEYQRLQENGHLQRFEGAGVEIVADTCVVVAPILPARGSVLMTNSGKFAHYTPATTGYDVVYGSLEDCVRSAATGRVTRDEGLWS